MLTAAAATQRDFRRSSRAESRIAQDVSRRTNERTHLAMSHFHDEVGHLFYADLKLDANDGATVHT